jgi:hypothetical protein
METIEVIYHSKTKHHFFVQADEETRPVRILRTESELAPRKTESLAKGEICLLTASPDTLIGLGLV